MPEPDDRHREAAEEAASLARDFAPELGAVLLTHFPDADTLDLMRPWEEDLGAVAARNRAVAAELAGQGVKVFVQVADRAAFRAWMDGRPDTQANRLCWRARAGLLSGPAALRGLGLDPAAHGTRTAAGKSSGSPADRLVRAFVEGGEAGFDELLGEALASGRQGVLDVALRKLRERYADEAVEDFTDALWEAAEGAEIGPSGWAELVALPVALPAGDPPEAGALVRGVIASGAFPETLEVRFLPRWRSPEALAALLPTALRRVLVDLVEGREPADLPPASAEALAQESFGLLLGVQFDWNIPIWEEIARDGPPREDAEGEETPQAVAAAKRFDAWRAAAFEATDGCVPLALVPPSLVGDEIADFLSEAGEHTGGLEEIRGFVDVARGEAAGEEVVCRPEVVGEALELTLYTRGGRFLDSLTLTADRLPASAEEMPRLIEAFVPLVKDAPGR